MRLSAVALCLLPLSAHAFSTFAGSCKHAGVNHGLDKFAAQECVPPLPCPASQPADARAGGAAATVCPSLARA